MSSEIEPVALIAIPFACWALFGALWSRVNAQDRAERDRVHAQTSAWVVWATLIYVTMMPLSVVTPRFEPVPAVGALLALGAFAAISVWRGWAVFWRLSSGAAKVLVVVETVVLVLLCLALFRLGTGHTGPPEPP
jgi:hypothetical protein